MKGNTKRIKRVSFTSSHVTLIIRLLAPETVAFVLDVCQWQIKRQLSESKRDEGKAVVST